MSTIALISFRLGGTDGVAIEAAKWRGAFETLGHRVFLVAGAGPVDVQVPALALGAVSPPTTGELEDALVDADLVVVENLCSLPLNPAACDVLATVLRGWPAVLHHHDLPWQRPHLAHLPGPPDDAAWRHVTTSDLSRRELAERGIEATTIHNAFDPSPPRGRRDETRAALDIAVSARLVLQPTRALARKNVGAAIRLAESLDATYWLLGDAEDGFGPTLKRLLDAAGCPVRRGFPDLQSATADGVTIADAYGAADVVAMPSTWEGFGNPTIESATHRLPLAVAPYPVAEELRAAGFRWFPVDDPGPLGGWLADPDLTLLDHNAEIARRHFSLADLPGRLAALLTQFDLPS